MFQKDEQFIMLLNLDEVFSIEDVQFMQGAEEKGEKESSKSSSNQSNGQVKSQPVT